MQPRGVEWKVGLFLVIGILLAAVVVMRFGTLGDRIRDSQILVGVFGNSGGIVGNASVVCAGVPVGRVREVRLNPDGENAVHIVLEVYAGTDIRADGKLVIKQTGFLGDKYIEIVPGSPDAPPAGPDTLLEGEDPIDVSGAARNGVALLESGRQVADGLGRIVDRLDHTVLREDRLEAIGTALDDFAAAAGDGAAAARAVREAIDEISPRLVATLEAVEGITNDVDAVRGEAVALLAESRDAVSAISSNAAETARGAAELVDRWNSVTERIERGEGVIGRLLADDLLYDELTALLAQWRTHGVLSKDRISQRRLNERQRETGRGRIAPAPPSAPVRGN